MNKRKRIEMDLILYHKFREADTRMEELKNVFVRIIIL